MEIARADPLAISLKKTLLRCLMRIHVRKPGDDTDNKGKSKLTEEVHSEIGQTSRTEIFSKHSTTEIRKLFRKKLHCSRLTRF